jgi:hypothetical protein
LLVVVEQVLTAAGVLEVIVHLPELVAVEHQQNLNYPLYLELHTPSQLVLEAMELLLLMELQGRKEVTLYFPILHLLVVVAEVDTFLMLPVVTAALVVLVVILEPLVLELLIKDMVVALAIMVVAAVEEQVLLVLLEAVQKETV